ncbi:hypothetical protein BDR03DRAFT_715192 [Suillus americanus]|nr:hypothetical protein BDR03DRAFT_715192 [Suillus americanus]
MGPGLWIIVLQVLITIGHWSAVLQGISLAHTLCTFATEYLCRSFPDCHLSSRYWLSILAQYRYWFCAFPAWGTNSARTKVVSENCCFPCLQLT